MSRTLFGEIEAIGEARGEAIGEAKGTVRAILIALKARFEREVPATISKRLLKIDDLVVLDSLTQLAATCETLDEFKKAVR